MKSVRGSNPFFVSNIDRSPCPLHPHLPQSLYPIIPPRLRPETGMIVRHELADPLSDSGKLRLIRLPAAVRGTGNHPRPAAGDDARRPQGDRRRKARASQDHFRRDRGGLGAGYEMWIDLKKSGCRTRWQDAIDSVCLDVLTFARTSSPPTPVGSYAALPANTERLIVACGSSPAMLAELIRHAATGASFAPQHSKQSAAFHHDGCRLSCLG